MLKICYYLFFSNTLNTIIMTATIHPQPVTLKENVTLVFTNVQVANLFIGQFSNFFIC